MYMVGFIKGIFGLVILYFIKIKTDMIEANGVPFNELSEKEALVVELKGLVIANCVFDGLYFILGLLIIKYTREIIAYLNMRELVYSTENYSSLSSVDSLKVKLIELKDYTRN